MIRNAKRSKNDPSCNPAELLKIMSFYAQTQPTLQGRDLLQISGFKIKGLRGIKQQSETLSLTAPQVGPQMVPHKLAWHESMGFGICTCFKWVGELWSYDLTAAQHRMHARKTLNGAHDVHPEII